MTEAEEIIYNEGMRDAMAQIISDLVRQIGAEQNPTDWSAEREEVRRSLRELCSVFGDNDWTDDLNLSDVIEKHLARHLYAREG